MNVKSVAPQIRTTNLDESIEFYVSRLGFELDFRYEDFYAGIKIANDQQLHLKLVDDKDPSICYVRDGNHLHLFFFTEDVESYADKLRANGVKFHSEVAVTSRGSKDFSIIDDQGHVLCFSETSES